MFTANGTLLHCFTDTGKAACSARLVGVHGFESRHFVD
jgi:hypothetical protein